MIADLIYAITIQPIEIIMSLAFSQIYNLVNSYGFAIILLSAFVNLFLIPLYLISDRWIEEERIIQEKMRPKLEEIKNAFFGQERFMMIKMLYSINNYHPFLAFKSSFGLLIQIPFFIAAYQLISNFEPLANTSFIFFDDLSKPDQLLSFNNITINIMPFVMTAINLASGYIYSYNLPKKDQTQIYLIAAAFLLLLYFMPVGLVLYWTINNIFSLFKNLLYKKLSKPKLMKLNNKWLERFSGIFTQTLLIYLSMVLCFLLVPIFMIGNSPEDYYFIDANVFYKTGVLFTLIGTVLLGFINIIFKYFFLNKFSTYLIYFGLSFIIFSGFIFPVSESAILTKPENNPVNYMNLLFVIAISSLIAYFSILNYVKNIQLFLTVIVLITISSSISAIYDHEGLMFKNNTKDFEEKRSDLAYEMNESLNLSSKKNIIVMSFDGLSGDSMNQLIKNNSDYNYYFKDFIFFENTINQAPNTKISLIGDIWGIQDYKSIGSDRDDLRAKLLNSDLYKNSPINLIDDSFSYRYYDVGVDEVYFNTPSTETYDFFRYPLIRIASSYSLKLLNWKRMYRFREFAGVNQDNELTRQLEDVKKNGIHEWNKGIIDFFNYNSLLNSLSANKKDMSIRYMHFSFTHSPVLYDLNCIYRGNEVSWFNANQNENGLNNQNECGIKKFISFLAKLKQLGIYENSLLVFKSDHGQENTFFEKYPYNSSINNTEWGYDRYKSFLMIKDFNSNKENLTYRDELVLQNDIAKTICIKSKLNINCDQYNGLNLLEVELKIDDPYYIYFPESNENEYWRFENWISVQVQSRKTSLLKVMENSKYIEISESGN